jgi:RecA-family ATPase
LIASSAMDGHDVSRGLVELMDQINEDGPRLAELTNEFASLMNEFQSTVSTLGDELKGADQAKGRVILTRMADSIKDVAHRMDDVGTEMELVTARVDGAFRSAWSLAVDSGHDDLKDTLRSSVLGSNDSNFSELSTVVDMMTDVLDQMKGVEVISVPMRAALQPLRKGVTSVRSAVSTVQSWPNVVI